MIIKLAKSLDGLMKKYTPDPFIYALILTALVLVIGVVFHDNNIADVVRYWGDGFWALTNFTHQMVMILFLGYVAALASPVKKMLAHLASLPKNLAQAAAFSALIALLGCWLNWGFGLIISALFCKELGQKFGGRGFSTLVACSYSGFLVWHGGLSGSIPLVVSTPGNFSEQLIGRLVPINQTVFSNLNIVIVVAHIILMPILAYYLMRVSDTKKVTLIKDRELIIDTDDIITPAGKIENNPLVSVFVVTLASSVIVIKMIDNRFHVDLDTINFILFILALALHVRPRNFLQASQQASSKIWPLLIQYPFYAGIMSVMQKSGIAESLSHAFVDLATKESLPLLVFLSAGLVNIFIPSGGGQWAVQGPMVIAAAQELGADVTAAMMAVAWGDAWTNMIQPFWALPLLAIAGLRARDIMGSLVFVLIASGLITSSCFIIFS